MHALFVASGGGHLSELRLLAERLPGLTRATWATSGNASNAALLAGADVRWVPDVPSRDVAGAIRLLPQALRIIRETEADIVVSTGAAVAVPFLIAATLQRRGAHYIESAARVRAPSLTGRIARRIPGVRTHCQHHRWAGPRWPYAGSVYDGFVGAEATPPPSVKRVVVTIGSMPFGFERLANQLTSVLPSDVDTLVQLGHTKAPKALSDRCAVVTFIEHDALVAEIEQADVVICHAGVGSSLLALGAGRWPILVPRRAGHGEHVDDHQTEIAGLLDAAGLGLAREVEQLTTADLDIAAQHRVERVAEAPAVRLLD